MCSKCGAVAETCCEASIARKATGDTLALLVGKQMLVIAALGTRLAEVVAAAPSERLAKIRERWSLAEEGVVQERDVEAQVQEDVAFLVAALYRTKTLAEERP